MRISGNDARLADVGNALVRAILRRPVVAPAFGAVRELLREGQPAFCSRPAIGAAGLELAREFAWPKIAAATVTCYRGIADCRL